MESMEEILDLEELQENIIDENLKEFMTKDEEAEKLLREKIDELVSETEKLNKKEEEIKSLEESSREKISMNASPDELIEIAEKIKSAQSELSEITDNIEKLEKEKEELDSTKKNVENSKREYIKNLNSTSLNYQEQIKKIEDAISVCDNPSLKQALEDVKKEKENELLSLQESRKNALKSALIPIIENESKEDDIFDSVDNTENLSEKELLMSYDQNSLSNNDLIVNPFFESRNDEIDNKELLTNNIDPIENIDIKKENVIGIDSILNNSISMEDSQPKLNPIVTDTIIINKDQIPKVKIILEKNVPIKSIKEIYSSSMIMPNIYKYLEEDNIINGGSSI